jgi:alpha-tubulin suppressor-like RCC1 family protein
MITGDNTYGQCTGDSKIVEDATAVDTLVDVKTIACGIDHTLALTKEGSVYSWGRGDKGQVCSTFVRVIVRTNDVEVKVFDIVCL